VKITNFWDVMPHSAVDMYKHFRGMSAASIIRVEKEVLLIYPEGTGSMFL
jgi:hypothetical protein